MSVRIITDSASDMSPAEHPALSVLPLSVTFGTDVYMDGVDIDHQRFYEMLVERDELPMTGQVNPYAFSQAIAEVREAGDEAVIITVGAKLSGTNQSARTALAEAPGGDVFVVDSNNVTLGERVLVEYALRLVDEGQGAAQIAAAVEAVRNRVVVIGLLETLEYLVRGGRLSAAAGAVGTLLNVKPVVAAEDGRSCSWARRAAPRTAATCSTRRSKRRAASTFPCRWRLAIRAFRMQCSRSISRTARRCGLAASRASCPFTPSALPSVPT